MGILVDGKWRDEDLPQETGKAGNFQRDRQRVPRPHHRGRLIRVSRRKPGAIISMSPTPARGRIARKSIWR